MISLFVGLSVAGLWGVADIFSSYSRLSALQTTVIAQASGLILVALTLSLFFLLQPVEAPVLFADVSRAASLLLLFSLVLGCLSAATYLALYFALASGPLAVVSPLVGAQGGVTMIGALLLLRDQVSATRVVLLALLLLGILAASTFPLKKEAVKISAVARFKRSVPGVMGALFAMVGFSGLNLAVGDVTSMYKITGALLFLLCLRIFSLFFLVIVASIVPAEKAPVRASSWGIAGLAGLLEMAGLVLFSSAVLLSSTMLAGVLSSVYPLCPLIFGMTVRHERLTVLQLGGTLCILSVLVVLPFSQ